MNFSTEKRLNSGQAILIVMLVMAVVLVMVLSVVARSVTDVKVSKTEEEASRAFSAAEAGIESALLTGKSDPGDVPGGDFSVSFAQVGHSKEYNHPKSLESGDTAIIWFVGHDDDGLACTMKVDGEDKDVCYDGDFIKVFWRRSGSGFVGAEPAIEVSLYYALGINFDDFSNVRVQRSTFDYFIRDPDNHFGPSEAGGNVDDGENIKSYDYSGTIHKPLACPHFLPCMIMASVRMLYNDPGQKHNIGVVANGTLPPQGEKIQSTGTSGEATRKVEVYELFPAPPAIFETAIYSNNSLVK